MKTFKQLRSRLNEDFVQRALTRMGVKTQPYAVDTMPTFTATPENIAAYEQDKKDAQAYVRRFGGIRVVQDPRELEAYSKDPLASMKQIPMDFITDPGPGGVGEIERKGRAELAAQEAEQRQGAIDMAKHTRQMRADALSRAQSTLAQTQSTLAQTQAERDRAQQNRRLERQASAAQSRFAQMSADAGRREANKEIARTTSDLQQSKADLASARTATAETAQRQEIRDRARQSTIGSQAQNIRNLEATIADMKADRDRLQGQMAQVGSDNDALTRQLEMLNATVANLETRLRQAKGN